ncbi:hypothetical protein N5P37_011788, partial [Trichoderma harzianum]
LFHTNMRSLLVGASVLLLVASKGASNAIPDATSAHELVQRDQIYHAKNGNNFAAESGFDYHGGDYKTITANTFYECIDACATQPACRAVSFSGKSCYLKSSVNAATANNKKSLYPAVVASGVDTAVLSSLLNTPALCPGPSTQQIKEPSGRSFTIACDTDYPGGDLTNKLLNSFGDCIAWCDEITGCQAAIYHDGRCWLKNKLMASSKHPTSQAAVLSSLLNTPALCPNQNGKQVKEPSGRSYTISCNTDRPGGDMASKMLRTFGDCITWCDETNGCVAAAYHDGQCWLKKTLMGSSASANRQVAVLSSKLPQTLAHTTSSSTKKTTSTTLRSASASNSISTGSGTSRTTSAHITSSSTQKTMSTTLRSASASNSISTGSGSSRTTSASTTATSTSVPDSPITGYITVVEAPATSLSRRSVKYVGFDNLFGRAYDDETNASLVTFYSNGSIEYNAVLVSGVSADTQVVLGLSSGEANALSTWKRDAYGNALIIGSTGFCLGSDRNIIVQTAASSPATCNPVYLVIVPSLPDSCTSGSANVTLTPQPNGDIDRASNAVLTPSSNVTLNYAEVHGTQVAVMNLSMKEGMLGVVLANSNKIISTACTASSLVITLSDSTSAADILASIPDTGTVLITSSTTCNDENAYGFWLLGGRADSSEAGSKLSFKAVQKRISDVSTLAVIQYGKVDNSKATFTTTTTGAPTAPTEPAASCAITNTAGTSTMSGHSGISTSASASATATHSGSSITHTATSTGSDHPLATSLSDLTPGALEVYNWLMENAQYSPDASDILGTLSESYEGIHAGICTGHELYENRDAIHCFFTGCGSSHTIKTTTYQFKGDWQVKIPTISQPLLTQGPAKTFSCVTCSFNMDSVIFSGSIVLQMTDNGPSSATSAVVTHGVTGGTTASVRIQSDSAWQGSWDHIFDGVTLGTITLDNAFAITPQVFYRIGYQFSTDSAVDVTGGAGYSWDDASINMNILNHASDSKRNWTPKVNWILPQFNTGAKVSINSFSQWIVDLKVVVQGNMVFNPRMFSSNSVGMSSQYNFVASNGCPANSLSVITSSTSSSYDMTLTAPATTSTVYQTSTVTMGGSYAPVYRRDVVRTPAPRGAFDRRAIAVPTGMAGWPIDKISYACSQIATGTNYISQTNTVTVTSGVTTSTATQVFNANGPLVTTTTTFTFYEFTGFTTTTTSAAATATSCPVSPAGASCFRLAVQGGSWLEGSYLGINLQGSHNYAGINRAGTEASSWEPGVYTETFYLDANGHLVVPAGGGRSPYVMLDVDQNAPYIQRAPLMGLPQYFASYWQHVDVAKCVIDASDICHKTLTCQLRDQIGFYVRQPFYQAWETSPDYQFDLEECESGDGPCPPTKPSGLGWYDALSLYRITWGNPTGDSQYIPVTLGVEDAPCPCDFLNVNYMGYE